MRNHILIIVTCLSIATIQSANAQNAPTEVDLQHPNLEALEQLTFLSVNNLRKDKGEPDLIWNDVLYRAAKDHANYLMGEKSITHFQTVRGKQTPDQRVKLHGGVSFPSTGENIVQVTLGVQSFSLGKIRSTFTYTAAGASMADLWKNSPGHYKNIISKVFNCAALATAYDSATRRLVAVQVFGYTSAPEIQRSIPDYATLLITSSPPKLPHGLKEYHPKAKHQKAANAFLRMKLDRGYLTSSCKTAKKIFKGRRSGIVQEFIPLQQFDSGSAEFLSVPNRRNGQYQLNGKLEKPPVYRRAMLKYARQNTKRSYFIDTKFLRIKRPATKFVYPLYENSKETESNVFLVKSKQLVVFKSYLKVPAELFQIPFPELEYKNSFKPLDERDRFRYHHQYDTSTLTIYYSPEEVKLDDRQQQEVKKTFNGRGKIISIDAAAFASIEGNKSTNDRLAKDRMDYFMELAKPFLDTVTVYPEIDTREQWELFYAQIRGTRLDNLDEMDADEVRNFINQNKKDTLIARLLDEQRYTHIKLVWRQDFREKSPSKSPMHRYDSLKSLVDQIVKPKAQLLNALEKAQLAVYDTLSQQDNITTDDLPEISGLERYPTFKYHDLVFRYTVMKNVSAKVFYDSIHAFAASKTFPRGLRDQLVYNNLALIYKSYINGTLADLMDYGNLECSRYRQSQFHLKKFKKLKCAKKHDDGLTARDEDYYVLKEIPALIGMGNRAQANNFPAPELWKYYYLNVINTLYPTIPIDQEVYQLLPAFKKHFHPDDSKLSDEERLKLAYFYCALHRYNIAKDLIEPLASRTNPSPEALKLHISLKAWELKDSEITELLIKEYPRLGKAEWCNMIVHPRYLNFLLLEDLKLKKFLQLQLWEIIDVRHEQFSGMAVSSSSHPLCRASPSRSRFGRARPKHFLKVIEPHPELCPRDSFGETAIARTYLLLSADYKSQVLIRTVRNAMGSCNNLAHDLPHEFGERHEPQRGDIFVGAD